MARRLTPEHITITQLTYGFAATKSKRLVPLVEGNFKGSVWVSFDPKKAISLLCTNGESFYAHKQVVAEALIAWMLNPRMRRVDEEDLTSLQQAVALETIWHVSALEKMPMVSRELPSINIENKGLNQALGNLMRHMIVSGIYFFDEIYGAIGGLDTLLLTPQRSAYYAKRAVNAAKIQDAITIAKIFHYNMEYLSNRDRFRPGSINTAKRLVRELLTGAPSLSDTTRTVYDSWLLYDRSISMLYAASRVKIGNDRSLLSHIIDGRLDFDRNRQAIIECLRLARFFANDVLLRCSNSIEAAKNNLAIFPEGIEPKPFQCCDFSERQGTLIASAFDKRRSG